MTALAEAPTRPADAVDAGPPVLPALWRARWRILLAAVIAGLLGFLLSGLQAVRYTTTAQLLLADPRNAGVFEDSGVSFLDPSRYIRNQAELAESAPVVNRTAELISGRLTLEEVRAAVSVRPSVDLDLLTVTATDATAAGAAELATAAADAYQETVLEQSQAGAQASLSELQAQEAELQAQIDAAEQQLEASPDNAAVQAERDGAIAQLIQVQNRSDQIAVDTSLFGSGIQLFEEAQVPDAPSAPQPVRNAALAAVLGVLAMGGLAWWRADETAVAAGRNDAAAIIGAPLLGQVPEFAGAGIEGRLPTVTDPRSGAAEAYHFLVAALQHAMAEIHAKSLVVTSARPGDGKTTTALNLAVAAGRDGREVVLVDADIRARGLTQSSGCDEVAGIVDLARGDAAPDEVLTVLKAGSGLAVPLVPAGAHLEDAAAFFRTSAFRRAIEQMTELGELVILDTPPLLIASDTSAVAASVDAIVIVVPRGTPLRVLEEMRERLDFIGTPVIGYVFDKAGDTGHDYYYSAYGYRGRPRSADPVAQKRRVPNSVASSSN